MGPMIRLQSRDGERCVDVGRRKPKREVLQDHAQCYLGLKQRKVLANADPWPPSEGEESRCFLGGLGDPLRKPLRLELVDIFSPYIWVVMNGHDWQQKFHSRWVLDPSQLHLLVRFPF